MKLLKRIGNDLYFKVKAMEYYNVSSDAELKAKWISDMNYIQESIYYSIINYTKSKENIAYEDFGYFLKRFKDAVGKGKSYEYGKYGLPFFV